MILALETQETSLWQVSLVVGAVVIAVVIALLALLLSFVGSIETGVRALLPRAARWPRTPATSKPR